MTPLKDIFDIRGSGSLDLGLNIDASNIFTKPERPPVDPPKSKSPVIWIVILVAMYFIFKR